MPDGFDVFLSRNSRDKPEVEKIGDHLRARGLRVFMDKWELRPGLSWQEGLEEAVQTSRTVAIFVGAAGLGDWQKAEMGAALREKVPVIPVLLPGCSDPPDLTPFLEGYTWVDLREGLSEEGLDRLVWGITGRKPDGTVSTSPLRSKKSPGLHWRWAAGLALVAVALLLGAWLRFRKPEMYETRVQVLDPQGHPLVGSKVRASAGNEPHLLSDGWWEIQIPAAKAPADGHITLWAEHKEWEGNSADLLLETDRNPQVKIRLKRPESWLRGTVADAANHPLPGVRVTPQGVPSGAAVTDADGRFALKLAVPRETQVRLWYAAAGWKTGDDFCYAGRDTCAITLEKP